MNVFCEGTEAGQRESLVSRLRSLIRDYPAGIGIVKEFLQNADDAGATWLRLTLDLRSHPADRVPDSRMGPLLGPALLIESDQVFSDDDVRNIQTIGEGGKLGEASKTGRFGLGFNTAYNLTDYPCFATRDRIVCFDPHEDAVALGERPGRQWLLAELWKRAPDWPLAFGLERDVAELDRTVFRLPLRTPSQAHSNRICAHSFPADQVEAIFGEVATWGGTLLLFLRWILDLEARIVRADGTEAIQVSIRTINRGEVESSRARVISACAGRVEDLIERWATDTGDLPFEVYEHHLGVDTAGGARSERWIVCSGVFLDSAREILTVAQRMLGIQEKPLPLVGSAVRIEENGNKGIRACPVAGHLYCTLPLPDLVPLPFHVNGYFDLDSSRSQLTHGAHLIGDVQVRAEWNAALMRHAVPRAVGELLRAIGDRVDYGHLVTYYELWPDLDKLPEGPLAEFGRHLYAHLAGGEFVLVRERDESRWMSTKTVRLSASSWSADLAGALLEDGLALPDPPLPRHVVRGFDAVDMAPNPWSSAEIRDWVRVAESPDCALEDAPRTCLKERRRVAELLRFCSQGTMADLKGLPLALMADGTLRAYGSAKVFLADAVVRSLFRERSEWFLDAELQEAVSLKPEPRANLFEMGIANTILNLKIHLAPEEGYARKWVPSGDDVPNETWLLDLLGWLRRQELASHLEALKGLAFIPDQFARLVTAGHAQTPLLPEEGTPDDLRKGLAAFGVALVSGSPELLLSLRRLVEAHDGLVWPLTAPDLIDTLEDMDDLDSKVPAGSPHRKAVLTWLATADGQRPLDEDRLSKLKNLSLWPTQDGRVARSSQDSVFLPTTYRPPDFLGRLTLLRPGPSDAWRPLLRRLGVPQLDLRGYIERVFLPGYVTLEPQRQVEALCWLRDQGLAGLPEDERADDDARRIRTMLRKVRLVRCADGENHPPPALYHPGASQTLELLGPVAAVPDMDVYSGEPARWLELFSNLGMRRRPRPEDLVRRVDQLVEQSREGVDAVEKPLLAILDYLQEAWKDVGDDLKQYIGELSRRAWLPGVRDPTRARQVAGFHVTDDRLFRPSELYPQRLQHLVGSQAPLLARATDLPRAVRVALGMPAAAPLDVVVAHFAEVRDRWHSPGHGGQSPEAISTMAREVYRFLGLHARRTPIADEDEERGATDPRALVEAVDEMTRAPCIWDARTMRFWLSEHSFARPVPFFGDLRVQVAGGDQEGAGLDLLGRRREPGPGDFLSFLRDLSQQCTGNPLPEEARKQVLYALSQLEPDRDARLLTSDLPVLCQDGRLRAMNEVLVDDAPWWRDRLAKTSLAWLDLQVDPHLALTAGARRATESISEVLVEHDERGDEGLQRWCEDRQRTITSPEFSAGVLRLLAHSHGANAGSLDAESLQERLRLHMHACSLLRTGLLCPDFGHDQPFGEAEVPCFLDQEGRVPRLLIAADDPEEAIPAMAKAINRRLGDLALGDLAPLEAILRCRPGQVGTRLDQRRIPRLSDVVDGPAFDWQEKEESELEHSEVASVENRHAWVEPRHEDVGAQNEDDEMRGGEPDPDAAMPDPQTAALDAENLEATPDATPEQPTTSAGSGGTETPSATGRFDTSPEPASGQRGEARHRRRMLPYENEPLIVKPSTLGSDTERPMPASEDQPPLEPGRGRSGGKERRAQKRLRSYLVPDSSKRKDFGEEPRDPVALEVEVSAVHRVVAEEQERGHRVQRMHRQNEGYDLEVTVPGEPEPRMVEVKGLRGEWDARGVNLTPQEFRAAQEFGARYWLVVVEFALDPHAVRVTRIQDPAGSVTEFRLDDGWRALHPEAERLTEPAVGMVISTKDAGALGTIEEVRERGATRLIVVRIEGGGTRAMAFNPFTHVLSKQKGS